MKGFGTQARLSIGFRSLVGAGLTVVAAVLIITLSNWSYVRVDLSAAGRNTLDESVLEVIDQLPGEVTIDVFLRSLQEPYVGLHGSVLERLVPVLSVAQESRRNKLEVNYYDESRLEEAKLRQGELGVEGNNIVVFSNASGTRRSVQKLYGDVAVVDWGTPTLAALRSLRDKGIVDPPLQRILQPGVAPQPARLSIFRGEEVLAESLLRVADEDAIHVYFAAGHGEPDPANAEPAGVSKLKEALQREGFQLDAWDPSETPRVPPDCEILCLIGNEQPYPAGTLDNIREYALGGGRLIVVPTLDALDQDHPETLPKLLMSFGIVPRRGLVCEPLEGLDPTQAQNASELVRSFDVQAGLLNGHPVTQPLVERGRRIRFYDSTSFQRGNSPTPIKDLATTTPRAWLDLPIRGRQYDGVKDSRREKSGRFTLIMEAELLAPTPVAGSTQQRGRVLAVGSVWFFLNQYHPFNADFILNAFNWMAERDHRIRVSPLPLARERIDLDRSAIGKKLSWSLYLGLPGTCVLVGLVLAWRRRS